MKEKTRNTRNHLCQLLGAGAVLFVLSPALAAQESEERRFHGLYFGAEVGSQNIFGGALVNGQDILTEDKRVTASGLLGWRYQFKNGLVVGLEGQLGITDGDLSFNSPTDNLQISYENSSQSAYGLTLGYAFGTNHDWLFYAYGLETSRDFDVTIAGPLGVGTQNDNQGMVRYGVGIEKAFGSGLHVRAAAGTLAADFGDANTNIDVEGRLDLTLSVLFRF